MNDHKRIYHLHHDGTPLHGTVTPGRCKHHSAALLAAGLATKKPFSIGPLPHIIDTTTLLDVMRLCGANDSIESRVTRFDFFTVHDDLTIDETLCKNSRNIFALLPGLARENNVVLAIPRGCDIGNRSFDWYLDILNQFGYNARYSDQKIRVNCARPRNARIKLPSPSYMGSLMAIICASISPGCSTIENFLPEESVKCLLANLESNGIKITYSLDHCLEIHGDPSLCFGKTLTVPFDREEIVTLAIAAIITAGTIHIDGCAKGLKRFIEFLQSQKIQFSLSDEHLEIDATRSHLKGFNCEFSCSPSMHTDWAPLFAVMAFTAHGESRLIDKSFARRFQFMQSLSDRGTAFHWNKEFSDVSITPLSGRSLKGGSLEGYDLRGSVACLLSGLISQTPVQVKAFQIERGYENLLGKLSNLGVSVTRETYSVI